MPIRLQLSRSTVKDLHSRLQQAYRGDDVRLVRRTTVWIDLLVSHVPVEGLSAQGGLSTSCMYAWRQDFLLHGVESVVSHPSGGWQTKLPPPAKATAGRTHGGRTARRGL